MYESIQKQKVSFCFLGHLVDLVCQNHSDCSISSSRLLAALLRFAGPSTPEQELEDICDNPVMLHETVIAKLTITNK